MMLAATFAALPAIARQQGKLRHDRRRPIRTRRSNRSLVAADDKDKDKKDQKKDDPDNPKNDLVPVDSNYATVENPGIAKLKPMTVEEKNLRRARKMPLTYSITLAGVVAASPINKE